MKNNLPTHGASRQALNYLYDAPNRSNGLRLDTIRQAIENEVGRETMRGVMDDLLVSGFVKCNVDGQYKITAEARKLIAEDIAASAVKLASNFKPRGVQPSWRDNVARQGSDEFLKWESKHV